jgi:ketosteroid isomerase-like protein
MSREAIETLRGVYDAVSRGDWDAAFRDAGPDFEFIPPNQNPIAGAYRGREAILGFFEELWAAFDEVAVTPGEFMDMDDRILVFLLMRLRPTDSDAMVEMQLTHLWTLRDDTPVRCEVFLRREEALEAAALSE